MFLYIRLLLAHFIGDFPLQFDFIYKLKLKGIHGVIPHVLIISCCSIILSWPYLHLPFMWLFLAFLAVTHLVQDSIKLVFSNPRHVFWSYVVDQASHIGLISLMLLTGLKDLPAPQDGSNIFVRLYYNNGLIIYLIVLIAATYNGHYLIRAFKDTFMARSTQCYVYEKWFGMFERAVIVSLFLVPLPLWVIIPLCLALRPLTYVLMKRALALHTCFMSLPDMILSWITGLAGGIILYLLQARYPVY